MKDLGWIAISLVIWGIGEGMFFFFQPLYLQELGADPVTIGAILGGVGMAMTIAHLPAGYLSDRIGRKPLLVLAWIVGTLAAWTMALARSLPVFVLGSCLYGFTSFVAGPLNSYVTTARGRMSVGRALTLISASFNVGAVLGPLIGGWVGDELGLHRTFLIAAVLFIISTLVILLIRPQPIEKSDPGSPKSKLAGLLTPNYIRYLVIIFLVTFSLYLAQPLSQNFLQTQRGLLLSEIGVLISARALGVVLLNLGLGQINARIGFTLAQAGMALFTLLIWRGSSFPWYFLGYLLLGGYQTARSLAIAQSRNFLGGANMGLGYGLLETISASAIILGPPVAGLLYAQSPELIYSVSLVLIILSLIISYVLSPIRAIKSFL